MKIYKQICSIGFFILFSVLGCSKSVKFSPEHIAATSGRYLYSADELMEVHYNNNHLFIKYKGVEKEPVILDENTIFVPDMYQKLRFIQHPGTQKLYLGIVSKDDETVITYDYLKVDDAFKTPSMHLEDKEFDQALEGFLEIKKRDSTSAFIDEYRFNRLGYDFLREKDYTNAIEVFKMNVVLFPDSDNVYDSLADAYLRSGDSLQAFMNYSRSYELNTGNERAERYIKAFNENRE